MSGPGIAIAGLLGPMLLTTAMVPAMHSSSGAQDAGDVDVVTARKDNEDRLTVPVKIGERGPYRFLVDTGAQNTIVSSSLAAELALPSGKQARIIGVAGTQMADTVEIDEIGVGRRSAYGLQAPLLDAANIGADGILGIDSLQGQRVLFDFSKNVIAMQEPRRSSSNGYEIVVTGHRRAGQLLITDAEIDGVHTSVVIDTGAESSIGNRALQRKLSRRMKIDKVVVTSVTGQQIVADIGLAHRLAVGDLKIDNVAVAFTDAPAFEQLKLSDKPALLLGIRELRAFNRVAIDFSSWRVMFDLPNL